MWDRGVSERNGDFTPSPVVCERVKCDQLQTVGLYLVMLSRSLEKKKKAADLWGAKGSAGYASHRKYKSSVVPLNLTNTAFIKTGLTQRVSPCSIIPV